MASAVSLANMVLSVRRRANIERQYAFIPDVELVEYVNYAIRELYDLLCEMGGQEYYRATRTLTTNSTDDTYPLPPDFYRMVSVTVRYDTNVRVPILPYMEEERAVYQNIGGWSSGRPAWYRMLGRDIRFIPSPSGSFSVDLAYYPVFEPLAAQYTDATQRTIFAAPAAFDGINGWEELPIWRTVAYCKQKGDEDPSYAQQRCAELDERIRRQAAARDAHNPERVKDVLGMPFEWDW